MASQKFCCFGGLWFWDVLRLFWYGVILLDAFRFCIYLDVYFLLRLSILVWDPCAQKQIALPAAEIPYHCADYDGRFVVRALDRFLFASAPYLRAIVFDAATAHQLLRRAFFGTLTDQDTRILNDPTLKFFNRLHYKPMPEHILPRLPIKLAFFEGEAFCALPAPCGFIFFSWRCLLIFDSKIFNGPTIYFLYFGFVMFCNVFCIFDYLRPRRKECRGSGFLVHSHDLSRKTLGWPGRKLYERHASKSVHAHRPAVRLPAGILGLSVVLRVQHGRWSQHAERELVKQGSALMEPEHCALCGSLTTQGVDCEGASWMRSIWLFGLGSLAAHSCKEGKSGRCTCRWILHGSRHRGEFAECLPQRPNYPPHQASNLKKHSKEFRGFTATQGVEQVIL